MPPNGARIREALRAFDFTRLFIEELGWDRPPSSPVDVLVEGRTYRLAPAAHKRGFVVYLIRAQAGVPIPSHPLRAKIDRQAAKAAREHIIIYIDESAQTQVWQWVRREPGRPTASRQ